MYVCAISGLGLERKPMVLSHQRGGGWALRLSQGPRRRLLMPPRKSTQFHMIMLQLSQMAQPMILGPLVPESSFSSPSLPSRSPIAKPT